MSLKGSFALTTNMTIECYDYMTYEYYSKISYGKPDNILSFTQYVLKTAAGPKRRRTRACRREFRKEKSRSGSQI